MPISRKPLSKGEKTLLRTCIFGLLPLGSVVFLYWFRDIEPTWNIPIAAQRPIPNGYDFYISASKARVRFSPPVDAVLDTSGNAANSPYALKNFSLTRRQQWLRANDKTFSLVVRGLRTPSMAPDFDFELSKHLGQLRELGRVMVIRTHTFQMAHQPMRVTMNALDTMQMGQEATRGSNIVGRLSGVAIVEMGRKPLDDWNKTINTLSGPEARIAARRLEKLLAGTPTATETMIGEKRAQLLELRQMFHTKGWRGSWASQEIMDGVRENPAWIWRRQTTSKQTIYDNRIRVLDMQIASSKLPYSQSKMPLSLPTNDVFNWYLTSTNRYFMIEARHATSNNMLLLRLALRAYIAEYGVAPPTLAALAPTYLKSIPTDVYSDGRPLFYVPRGKSYKLWSVGPDSVDNGGVPLAREPNDKPGLPTLNRLDNTGDFVAGVCR